MPDKKRKNFWYWLGNAVVGLLGISVAYSDKILPAAFPEKTIVNKLAIPISIGLKFLWDSWRYKKGSIADSGKKLYDKLPDGVTGRFNSKKE